MNKKPALLSSLAASLLFASCGKSLVMPSDVTGSVWKLQKLASNGTTVTIAQPSSYTVEFKAGNQMGVKADCNVCGGMYTISGSSLAVSSLACTLAFCGTQSNDTAFLAILNSSPSLVVAGGTLTIQSAKGTAYFNQ